MGYDLKDIMEWLGHSDIKMTGNLYAHFNMRQKQRIAASFSEKFKISVEQASEN
jgi:Phage integrase family.